MSRRAGGPEDQPGSEPGPRTPSPRQSGSSRSAPYSPGSGPGPGSLHRVHRPTVHVDALPRRRRKSVRLGEPMEPRDGRAAGSGWAQATRPVSRADRLLRPSHVPAVHASGCRSAGPGRARSGLSSGRTAALGGSAGSPLKGQQTWPPQSIGRRGGEGAHRGWAQRQANYLGGGEGVGLGRVR